MKRTLITCLFIFLVSILRAQTSYIGLNKKSVIDSMNLNSSYNFKNTYSVEGNLTVLDYVPVGDVGVNNAPRSYFFKKDTCIIIGLHFFIKDLGDVINILNKNYNMVSDNNWTDKHSQYKAVIRPDYKGGVFSVYIQGL